MKRRQVATKTAKLINPERQRDNAKSGSEGLGWPDYFSDLVAPKIPLLNKLSVRWKAGIHNVPTTLS